LFRFETMPFPALERALSEAEMIGR
jgi:hypothetical protein